MCPTCCTAAAARSTRDSLIIPYAMSDWASAFAAVDLRELLDELLAS